MAIDRFRGLRPKSGGGLGSGRGKGLFRVTGSGPDTGKCMESDYWLEMVQTLASFAERVGLVEVSPPGWSGSVKAMKKHMPASRAFALAWHMHKKGFKPHYVALPSSTSKKEPKLKKKYR